MVLMAAKELIKPTNYRVIGFKNQPHAMFQAYTDDETLLKNSKYTFQIKLKGQGAEQSVFLTQLNPYLSTIKRVRLETGQSLSELEDTEILYAIYQNSLEVADIGTTTDLDEETLEKRVKYEKMWVLYRTCYDLVYSAYLTKSYRYGVSKKGIGDLNVSKEDKLPLLDPMIQKFKTKMEQAEEQLNAIGSEDETQYAVTFTKASSNNTYSERGSF